MQKKISSRKISLEPHDSPSPIWPPFWRIAVQLNLLILLTCICFVPVFHICILSISFLFLVQCYILSNIVNVMALFVTVFPLFRRWDLQSLQLILSIICILGETCEIWTSCRRPSHLREEWHIINHRTFTCPDKDSPQIPEPRLHIRLLVGLSRLTPCIQG